MQGITNYSTISNFNIKLAKFSDIKYSDFQPYSGQSKTIVLGQLPAGAVPAHFKVKPSVAFTSNIDDLTASVRLRDGNNNVMTPSPYICPLTAVGDTIGIAGAVLCTMDNIPNQNEDTNIQAELLLNSPTGVVLTATSADDLTQWSQGFGISCPATNASGSIVSVTSLGSNNYKIIIEMESGDWVNTVGETVDDGGAGTGYLGEVILVTIPTLVTVDDLTDGMFDVWIWYIIGS